MLEPRQYLQQIQSMQAEYGARNSAGRPESENTDQNELNCIEFASANLRQLRPDIPLAQHTGIINEILFNQARAALDEDSCFLSETTRIIDPQDTLTTAGRQPVIFCTYHFGSYRIINQVLGSRGLRYLLPVSSDIYAAHKRRFEDNFAVIKGYFHTDAQLMVVNAEERTSALVMARKTRQGWSLLTYIDGNTGVQGASRRDAKMLLIPLLGRPMYARRGIAFLSHFLKLPIVPVVCQVTGPLQRRMTFHPRIEPAASGEDREAYCLRATEQLYAVLAEYLKTTPEQWEGWMYLQRHLETDTFTDPEGEEAELAIEWNTGDRLVFNHRRFGFIIQENERVLLDKANYKLLSLPDQIWNMLDSCREPREFNTEAAAEPEREMLEQLVAMELLSIVHS
ncbi:MAG: hypothetical protein KGK44_04310 [Gammaproteobacteria bacterium]|nr:hypothetical protein [Gammaproteobacteria bacterium]